MGVSKNNGPLFLETSKWLITMVIVSLRSRVVGPLPNGGSSKISGIAKLEESWTLYSAILGVGFPLHKTYPYNLYR